MSATGPGDSSSPRIDPWEARERQREKWRRAAEGKSGRGARSSPRSPEAPQESNPGERGFQDDYVAWGLLVTVGVLLLAEVPTVPASSREMFARIGTLLLVVLIGGARGFLDNLRAAALRGINPLILLLLAWSVYELVRAPFRDFAVTEILRILDGAGLYFLCAYCLRAPRQTGLVVAGLIVFGVGLSLVDIGSVGQRMELHKESISSQYSVFGTHENAASLLILLLPIALAFGTAAGVEEKRRLAAAAAALILGVAELVARTRSAWIGGFVAVVVLAILSLKYPNSGRDSRPRRRAWTDLLGSPAALIAGAMLAFLIVAGAAPYVLHRAQSIQAGVRDPNTIGRLDLWSGAVRMASEKPISGWGLGAYPVIQGRWTHSGVEAQEALANGVAQESSAHEYYAQWAAETGGIGLFLYAATLCVFLWTACRALPRVTAPIQRALLCGCIATVAGGIVDSIASPAYTFHGVWAVYWCCIGLGVSAMRPVRRATSPEDGPALDRTPLVVWLGSAVVAAAVTVGVVGSGFLVVRSGAAKPRGRLELVTIPARSVVPGESVRWVALFHDAAGKDHDTMPGTVWSLAGPSLLPAALAHVKVAYTDLNRHTILIVVAPAMDGTLTAHATYLDFYGRRYDAWSLVTIHPAAPRRSSSGP